MGQTSEKMIQESENKLQSLLDNEAILSKKYLILLNDISTIRTKKTIREILEIILNKNFYESNDNDIIINNISELYTTFGPPTIDWFPSDIITPIVNEKNKLTQTYFLLFYKLDRIKTIEGKPMYINKYKIMKDILVKFITGYETRGDIDKAIEIVNKRFGPSNHFINNVFDLIDGIDKWWFPDFFYIGASTQDRIKYSTYFRPSRSADNAISLHTYISNKENNMVITNENGKYRYEYYNYPEKVIVLKKKEYDTLGEIYNEIQNGTIDGNQQITGGTDNEDHQKYMKYKYKYLQQKTQNQ